MLTALPVVAGGSLSRLVDAADLLVPLQPGSRRKTDSRWDAETTATLTFFASISTTNRQDHDIQQDDAPAFECQVAKASAIVENLAATAELHSRRISSASGDTEDILFLTWPVDRFFKVARQVVATYAKELGVKKCLVEEVAMVADSKTLSFYVAAWSYQAYVDDDCRLSLEALVREVGLK
ncbi:hypothetical protein HPB47_028004 [Ixodes persulcatus]|uniref:Uncharacterized protein n=1 Tax=Ixodes persulcatus TaxID=34615 RepID=A0AC60PUF2_IXOPE|nr:hypothetical protein HPB47_028004 [Ixodes persulcatus]